MTVQISGATAVLVSETDATTYYVGGTFQLGNGPFTDLSFDATDDDTDFTSFGAKNDESSGSGRQLGALKDGSGATYDQGLTSLEDVLTITDPVSGEEILVGRVSIRVDTGNPSGGAITQDFYIFSKPIDPTVSYTITDIVYTPGATAEDSFSYSAFGGGGVVCFANGTVIRAEHGPTRVEDIKPGMAVQTFDNGLKEVLWVGRQGVSPGLSSPASVPVRIAPGALGNDAPLFVSQQHRVLVGDRFVKATHLASVPGFPARLARGRRRPSYFHFLLEDHQVLFANGIGAESLYLGPVATGLIQNRRMGPPVGAGIVHGAPGAGGLARPMAKRHEVRDHVGRLSSTLAWGS